MAWTQADLDSIKKAYATGALRVEYPSLGTVTYRSRVEMKAIMNDISNELAASQGKKPVRRVKVIISKDY